MIPRARRFLICILMLGLVQAACSTVPIMDPPVESLPTSATRTEADVANAIRRAAGEGGWKTQDDGPGQMTATLNLRSHVAVVSITYDANSYEIRYKDSRNLDHEGKLIHRKYNGWVRKLDVRIRRQLGYG